MECFSFKDIPTPKNNAHCCFFGIVRGNADKYTEKEISQYINQCFDQTPELTTKSVEIIFD
jgi:hypothetical protein